METTERIVEAYVRYIEGWAPIANICVFVGGPRPTLLACSVFSFVLFVCEIHLPSASANPNKYYVPPHKLMFDEPVGFHGYQGTETGPDEVTEIRVGFFAPLTPDQPAGLAMWRGATLALEQANTEGGYRGKLFRLVCRWAPDPWRAGSNMVIQLVYEDHVWAIIGSIDGESTHVAEQIVTKARVSLLSPIATDSTLTYIRIPWMFRLAPDDERQASLLAERVTADGSVKRIVLVNSTRHDDRIGAEEMLRALLARRSPPGAQFTFDSPLLQPEILADRVVSASPDAMILWCGTHDAIMFLEKLATNGSTWPVYGPLCLNVPAFHAVAERWPGAVTLTSCWEGQETGDAAVAFERAYQAQYGIEPDFAAAYAFDAANLIVRSIRSVGLNRARIRDAIAADSGYHGVTGDISWDNGGGNLALLRLVTVRKLACDPSLSQPPR
jgi:branched-chain amino acid transport system substrate-binding protein